MTELSIEVWSDVACPWCWVGKRHLQSAIATLGEPVAVTWRSFELDPNAVAATSAEVDYADRLAKKYGKSRDQAQAMIDSMTAVGTGVGLTFRFDRAKPGNTFDAHRLLQFARSEAKQDAMKERLFEAYMSEGKPLGDVAVLVELATDVGLPAERVRALLASDAFTAEVRDDEATARELGIRGVPFFVINGQYAISGAQPSDVLVSALREAGRAAINGRDPEGAAPSCDLER